MMTLMRRRKLGIASLIMALMHQHTENEDALAMIHFTRTIGSIARPHNIASEQLLQIIERGEARALSRREGRNH